MENVLLSVTFIDDLNNRKWTYDNVTQIDTGFESVFVHCNDKDKKGVYANHQTEFTRIIVEKENDNRPITNADYLRNLDDNKLADWLCKQMWDDYDGNNPSRTDVIRFHSIRNFLKTEYEDIE